MSKMNEIMFSKSTLSKDISAIALLTQEEERALLVKAQKGDINAKKKLVESNLRFVIKIAKSFEGLGLAMDELVAEGALGLGQAVDKFNLENKNKFITYAVWWIRSYMEKAIRETGKLVRFPDNKYSEMKDDKWNFASLDSLVSGEDGEAVNFDSFVEDKKNISPIDNYEIKELMTALHKELAKLDVRERNILTLYFGLDNTESMSYKEIAKWYGLTKEGIRQIALRAIDKLRTGLQEKEYTNLSADYADRYWDIAA